MNTPETAHIVASIAHDLRSPLNAVIGFSRLMLKGIDGPLSEMQATDLEAIYANGNMMLDMVDNLIDLAKAETGWYRPAPAPVYLLPLLEKIVSLATPAAKEKQVQLRYAAGDAPQPIDADPSLVQKALERLVAAAIHLVGAGEVVVSAAAEGGCTTVHIAGTGPDGLALETPHSLEAFYSAGTSAEYRMDQTALQLLVGRQLLALNGGQMQVAPASDTEIHLTCEFKNSNPA